MLSLTTSLWRELRKALEAERRTVIVGGRMMGMQSCICLLGSVVTMVHVRIHSPLSSFQPSHVARLRSLAGAPELRPIADPRSFLPGRLQAKGT